MKQQMQEGPQSSRREKQHPLAQDRQQQSLVAPLRISTSSMQDTSSMESMEGRISTMMAHTVQHTSCSTGQQKR